MSSSLNKCQINVKYLQTFSENYLKSFDISTILPIPFAEATVSIWLSRRALREVHQVNCYSCTVLCVCVYTLCVRRLAMP